MLLIGVVGTTKPDEKTITYSFNGNTVEGQLSFMALYDLKPAAYKEIIVLGTAKAIETQQPVLQEFRSMLSAAKNKEVLTVIEMPAAQSPQQEAELWFQRILDEVRKRNPVELCIDLTQGFRHHSMMMFLVGLLQGLSGMKLNLYYSMVKGSQKNGPQFFEFVDLVDYLEIGNMAVILQLFPTAFNIPSFIQLQHKEFNHVKNELSKVAQAILENNLENAVKAAEDAEQRVKEFLVSPHGQFLQAQASGTLQLLHLLCQMKQQTKAQKMLQFGRIFLERHYFLNAATFLHEGLLRLLREISGFDQQCMRSSYRGIGWEYKASQTIKMLLQYNGESVPAQKGKFIKLKDVGGNGQVAEYLQSVEKIRFYYENNLKPYQEISRLIEVVDELRNNAAHGFIDKSGPKTYRDNIKAYFDFVEELQAQHKSIGFLIELERSISKLPGVSQKNASNLKNR